MQIQRDSGTRTAYAGVATYAFFLYFLGPVTPLIADQLGVSLSLAGLTGVALAAGLVVSGLAVPGLALRFGRRFVAIAAACGLAAGGLLLAMAPTFPAVLVAVFIAAASGATVMNVASAALADRHAAAGPRALTEANAAAAWVGLTAPLLIGAAVAVGLGWRVAALGISLVAIVLAVLLARVGLPTRSEADVVVVDVGDTAVAVARDTTAPTRLPRAFFLSLVAVVAAVGAEISLNFWGAVLISQNTGADLAVTTACISVMIAGIAVGRTVGSALTRRFGVATLIYGSLTLALLGFVGVWLGGAMSIAVSGLFVSGLGLALLYPLTSGLAIGHASGRTDRAVAWISVITGITLGAAPFALGALAGVLGVSAGFLIVPVLLAVGVLAVRGATQAPAPRHRASARPESLEPRATTHHGR